jgi:hypothetical protein
MRPELSQHEEGGTSETPMGAVGGKEAHYYRLAVSCSRVVLHSGYGIECR